MAGGSRRPPNGDMLPGSKASIGGSYVSSHGTQQDRTGRHGRRARFFIAVAAALVRLTR